MSKIKNGRLDQYGTGLFEQQQFRTAGLKGLRVSKYQDETDEHGQLAWLSDYRT